MANHCTGGGWLSNRQPGESRQSSITWWPKNDNRGQTRFSLCAIGEPQAKQSDGFFESGE